MDFKFEAGWCSKFSFYDYLKKSSSLSLCFNSLWLSDAIWRHNWVNIGSCNVFLPDGTKPLPEPMLTYHQWSCIAFIYNQCHKCSGDQFIKWFFKNTFVKLLPLLSGANELSAIRFYIGCFDWGHLSYRITQIFDAHWNFERNVFNFVVNTVFADELAPRWDICRYSDWQNSNQI